MDTNNMNKFLRRRHLVFSSCYGISALVIALAMSLRAASELTATIWLIWTAAASVLHAWAARRVRIGKGWGLSLVLGIVGGVFTWGFILTWLGKRFEHAHRTPQPVARATT